jgi:hypothetical protein
MSTSSSTSVPPITAVHVRRCDVGGELSSSSGGGDSERAKNKRARLDLANNSNNKVVESSSSSNSSAESSTTAQQQAATASKHLKFLHTSFYPALPAAYYLAALSRHRRHRRQQPEEHFNTGSMGIHIKKISNDDNDPNDSSNNDNTIKFRQNTSTRHMGILDKNDERGGLKILIVTPPGCRRSTVVQTLIDAFPLGVAQLAPGEEKQQTKKRRSGAAAAKAAVSAAEVKAAAAESQWLASLPSGPARDFSLLRSVSSALVLSVGTFSLWAAWLSQQEEKGNEWRSLHGVGRSRQETESPGNKVSYQMKS